MRSLPIAICVAVVATIGCSGTNGAGGNGGSAGVGGMGGHAGTGGGGAGLIGTWEFQTLEVSGMTTNCPGEITIIPVIWICPEGTFSFNADATFAAFAEAYDPDPAYWGEGTWSTVDDMLTMTYLFDGTSSDDLEPVVPPESWTARWSVSQTTLTLIQQDSQFDPPSTYTLTKR